MRRSSFVVTNKQEPRQEQRNVGLKMIRGGLIPSLSLVKRPQDEITLEWSWD